MQPRESTSIEDQFELMPARSVLYNLVPRGIGTERQESLTSYVIRLSRAHHVSPRDLIKHVFGPEDTAMRRLAHNTFYAKYAATVNGLGPHAKLVARLANHLTSRTDLETLTMLPWAGIIPEQSEGFIARQPRWCPKCFDDQLVTDGETHAPLVWSFVPYSRCSRHHCPLEEFCPKCGKPQPFIPRMADASVCHYCRASLSGDLNAAGGTGYAAAPDPIYDGYEYVLEAMVREHATMQGRVSHSFLCDAIKLIASQQFEGSRIGLCRAMGWNKWAINRWLDRGERISLPKLLQLGRRFGIPVIDLCSNRARSERPSLRSALTPITSRARRPRLTQDQRQQYLRDLTAKVSDDPAPSSLREAGATYGLTRSALRYWFPEMCQRISERGALDRRIAAERADRDRAKWIAEAVEALVRSGIRPTRRKIDKEIRKHGLALARPNAFAVYARVTRERPEENCPNNGFRAGQTHQDDSDSG
jgi:hypothetical protein